MDNKEQQLWDIFFSGVVGWQLHPGYGRENVEPMTLEECAELVDAMLKVRYERCRGLLQED